MLLAKRGDLVSVNKCALQGSSQLAMISLNLLDIGVPDSALQGSQLAIISPNHAPYPCA